MHPPGLFQLLVILLILVVLFGRGRISDFMGDVGKGVKNFRKSITEEEEPAQPVPVDGVGIEPALAETTAESPPDQVHK